MIDADVVSTETRFADDTNTEISNIHEDDSSDDDEEEAVLLIPTSAVTTSAFDSLFRAFGCNSDTPHNYFKQLQETKQFLLISQTSKLKQKQVADFLTHSHTMTPFDAPGKQAF